MKKAHLHIYGKIWDVGQVESWCGGLCLVAELVLGEHHRVDEHLHTLDLIHCA